MEPSIPIRILENENNRRGDLFGRLMADLFVALGYEHPRLNVHKSGREVDLQAEHRLEPRRAVAECKATKYLVGGDQVNKFVGALDAESGGGDDRATTGYFISLSGFKETAVEQERQGRRTRIITLTGPQVVNELVEGRILVPKDRATEVAGRLCGELPELELDSETELLAHARGWIWAVYYVQGKHRTHCVLVHADGTLLAQALAKEVIASDWECRGGSLHELTCLNPTPPVRQGEKKVQEARAAYHRYLATECGTIQLDGLPADSEVGSRRLRLENLFVPLHLDVEVRGREESQVLERQTVGEVLAEHLRLALLAPPGGGKSTLLKRLATAYADPSRREEVPDDLPDRDWLPLFFRCRELRGLARGSFADLLEALSQRDPVRQYAAAFRAEVDRALLAGRVLLLVDGLDEISDPGDRAAFVCTLRSTLQAYPGIAMVVTSREAGFRHVAAHLAEVCTRATLSPFDADDIRRLSVAWHTEVVGDTEKVRKDAEELAASIAGNDRILRLAVNPLLLTTLLLVKRWVGRLPTRRAVLYGKAVEVLLMTWNVEGHEPLREEEALPQLCYVASAMMLEGVQKISRPRLAALLQEAREALPTELGFVQDTVEDFVHRVEERSSLLMMSGHDVEDGRLVELFEFRHLTFQEFLTARAMVEGWHSGRKDEDTLVSVLEQHVEDEEWTEVISLAAVLGGKQTERLIQRLTHRVRELHPKHSHDRHPAFLALGNCLADEAAALPVTIREAIRVLVHRAEWLGHAEFTPSLALGRFGHELRIQAGVAFFGGESDLIDAGQLLAEVVSWQALEVEGQDGSYNVGEKFLALLKSTDVLSRCEGALGLMDFSFEAAVCKYGNYFGRDSEEFRMFMAHFKHTASGYDLSILRSAVRLLQSMVFSDKLQEQFASAWALVWLGACQAQPPSSKLDVLGRLFDLWRRSPDPNLQAIAGWAVTSQPLTSRESRVRCSSIDRGDLDGVLKRYNEMKSGRDQAVVLIPAWYLRVLDDAEIARRARGLLDKLQGDLTLEPTLRDLLERLGYPAPERPRRRKGTRPRFRKL